MYYNECRRVCEKVLYVYAYAIAVRPSLPRTVAGHFMMAAGHGLEADLRCMLESHVPLSRLRRMSGHVQGRGGAPSPIACSGGELERGGEPRPPSAAACRLSSARKKVGCVLSRPSASQVSKYS